MNRRFLFAGLSLSGFILIMSFSAIIVRAEELGETASLVDEAKKEGTVNYYASSNEDSELMMKRFHEKYPFIKVNRLRTSGEKLLIRALAEAKAGKLPADVYDSSIVQVLQMKENKLLMKYTGPENKAIPDKFKDPEGFWIANSHYPYVITYNTRLIPPKEAPKTYEDLLNPKWKGKIGMDAEEIQWFFHLIKIMGRQKGIEYMRSLAKQNVIFRKGHTLLNTLCAAGEIPIVVVGYLQVVEMLKANGAPVGWVRFESFPVISAIHAVAVIRTAPHPHAAKLLYNFILSREGARVFRDKKLVPARADEQPPEIKGIDFYVAYPDELMANYKQVTKEWEEIFFHR